MNAVVNHQTFTPDQLVARRAFVGGSESAAALGLNPYKSQFALWQEKCGIAAPFEGNETTLWGVLLEPVIRQQYSERTGNVVQLPADTIIHAEHRFMACHPDGYIASKNRLWEGKASRYGEEFGEEGSDEVPEHYRIQCLHNIIVCSDKNGELDGADLSVLIGGNEMHTYFIPRNLVLEHRIIEAEATFMGYVWRREPPPIDFARKDVLEVVKAMYPGTSGEILEATTEDVAWRLQREQAQEAIKQHTAIADEAKARLLARMGEATFLQFQDGKSFRRATVNRKAYEVRATSYMDFRLTNSK